MTTERAIEILDPTHREHYESIEPINEAMRMGQKAIERMMIAKKPTHEATLLKCCTCPNCKNVIDKFEKFGEAQVRVTYDYCHFCGQKLDWSDAE